MMVLFDCEGGEEWVKIFDRLKKYFANSMADTEGNNTFTTTPDKYKTYLMSEFMKLLTGRGGSSEYGEDRSEITYLTCLKVLSESIGKIPVYLIDEEKNRVDNDLSYILNVRPNPYQTPSQFFTYLEYCRNHQGNGYAFVNRLPNGTVEGLYPLDPSAMQVWVNNTDQFTSRTFYYRYNDTKNGQQYWFDPENILHFKSWLCEENGLVGKSIRFIIASTLLGAKASSKFLNNLNQHGLMANVAVKYVGNLKPESQNALLDEIEEQARINDRRMITLPMGFEIQPLDLKLTDSQFLELRRFTSLQIAAAFGIKPIFLNDLEKSSYASSSAQNLSFYVDTLLAIISQYEQEMRRKLLTRKEIDAGLKFKFNANVILRADPTAQADIIQKLTSCGIYSPNDARKWLDLPPIPGDAGNKILVNGSMLPIEYAGAAYKDKTGGDEDDKNQESS